MPKIKWKSQKDIDAEKAKQEKRQAEKAKFKNKKWQTMSGKDKDELLRNIATQLGLVDEEQ